MNEFEQHLKRQPVRSLPLEWRAEILSAARRASHVQHQEHEETSHPWWLAWLWPSPTAWAAVACAWILIFCLDAASRPEASSAVASTSNPAPGIPTILAGNLRLLQQCHFFTEEEALEPPKPPKLRRRESPGAYIWYELSTQIA